MHTTNVAPPSKGVTSYSFPGFPCSLVRPTDHTLWTLIAAVSFSSDEVCFWSTKTLRVSAGAIGTCTILFFVLMPSFPPFVSESLSWLRSRPQATQCILPTSLKAMSTSRRKKLGPSGLRPPPTTNLRPLSTPPSDADRVRRTYP